MRAASRLFLSLRWEDTDLADIQWRGRQIKFQTLFGKAQDRSHTLAQSRDEDALEGGFDGIAAIFSRDITSTEQGSGRADGHNNASRCSLASDGRSVIGQNLQRFRDRSWKARAGQFKVMNRVTQIHQGLAR